jgi:lipooligosaccharide transport system ATP-binding protein
MTLREEIPATSSTSRSPDEDALSLSGVTKRYDNVVAVDDLDLTVAAGTCLGLLGPNAADKSTTMRLLTGQSRADTGEIHVLGYKVPEESKQARALMGVVPQQDNLDIELTSRQNLAVFARLYPRAGTAPGRSTGRFGSPT